MPVKQLSYKDKIRRAFVPTFSEFPPKQVDDSDCAPSHAK